MGNIVDLSKFQPSNKIDWATFSKSVDLLICRVQYGSSNPDIEYNNHITNAKKYGIPFNTYSFPHFVSVNDARVEARDCWNRSDKGSEVIWLDIESEYDTNKNPVGITKLPQDVRLEGIKAYVDELRKQGAKKVGGYIAHNIYESWGINTIINIFDAVWIPRYGAKPNYPCDLHQYTSTGNVAGYNGNLDLSCIMNKPLEYFTGTPRNIYFVTGGYFSGDDLCKVFQYITERHWWYEPTRRDDGSLMFKVGGLAEGRTPAVDFENFLKTNGYWYQITTS